jgi:hypothetical protein
VIHWGGLAWRQAEAGDADLPSGAHAGMQQDVPQGMNAGMPGLYFEVDCGVQIVAAALLFMVFCMWSGSSQLSTVVLRPQMVIGGATIL